MAFTFDLATDVGRVRLLLRDNDPKTPVFRDDEISVYLEIEGGHVKRAAALALESNAQDEALVQKVMKSMEGETNGAATAKVLIDLAARWRDQAAKGQDAGDNSTGMVSSVDLCWGVC